MAVIETWLRQDLKAMVNVRSLQGQVFSLDNGGNLIGVKVTRDGEPVALEGTIAGYCILPDGETINITPASGNTGIQNGNEAYIILPQLAYSVPGQISIVIKLAQGSSVTTLAACTGYVYRSKTDNEVVPPGTPIPDLHTLETVIANANTATTRANTAAAAAENVDASMSKSGDVITIAVTDRDGVTKTETMSDQSDAVEELQNAIVTKAEQNGYYPDMTVGTTEQLVSDEGVTEAVPYLYRKSGGGVEVGNREKLEKIIGGTVAWNQLEKRDRPNNTVAGITFTQNEDGSITLNGTATGNSNVMPSISGTAIQSVNGHVYLGVTNLQNPSNNTLTVGIYNDQLVKLAGESNCIMYKSLVTGTVIQIGYRFASGTVLNNVKISGSLFDITQMFGSTIADYIYSLEQANAGAGVAWFRKLFPADYYPYNAGELVSVSGLSEHKMVGFNLWDEEWENGRWGNKDGGPVTDPNTIRSKNTIGVLPDTNYYGAFTSTNSGAYWYVWFYDKNDMLVENGNITNRVVKSPSNAHHCRLSTYGGDYNAYTKGDFCINLSDPSRNGEYAPYEKHSYQLDSSLTLRGIPKLDSENELYYDGDEYTPDGKVNRRYGVVDLGSLTWIYDSTATNKRFFAYPAESYNIKPAASEGGAINGICSTISVASNLIVTHTAGNYHKIAVTSTANRPYIVVSEDVITDPTVFKAAMSGVYLVYELATPTTEQSTPYNPIQVVDPYGTEEFVSTSIVPVGHSTKYLEDHVKKLEDTVRQLNDNVITETAGPASIVSIKDGADGMPLRNLSVAVEPVQDLHGYDHPWPGGGSKNILNITAGTITSNGVTFTVNADKTITLSGIADGVAVFRQSLSAGDFPRESVILNGCPSGGNYENTYSMLLAASNGSGIGAVDIGSGATHSAGELERVAQFQIIVRSGVNTNGLVFKPMIRLATEADSTYVPYSNICPISGWTGAKIFHCADNLYDKDSVQLHKNWIGGDADNRAYFIVPVTPGETYNISVIGCNVAKYIGYIEIDRPIAGTQSYSITINTPNVNFTRTVTSTYIGMQFSSNKKLTKQDVESVQVSISKGGFLEQVDITFPTEAGTVYGGTLDVTSGKLVVDRIDVHVTSAREKTSLSTDAVSIFPLNGTSVSNDGVRAQNTDIEKTTFISNLFPSRSIVESVLGGQKLVGISSSKTSGICYLTVPVSIATTQEEMNAWLAINEMHVVCNLITPITYQLTPQEITTLLGVNNIWADAGDTTITYPADTKMYIDNKITQAIAAALNS